MRFAGKSMPHLPVVDISGSDPDSLEKQIADIKKACLESGFFYVTSHGVSQDVVEGAFAAQREFFSLSLAEKNTIASDINNRGYTAMAEETLDPLTQKSGDTKEGIYYGREVAADSEEARKPLHGPNQWVSEDLVPGYRQRTEAYFLAVKALSKRLVHLVARSLGLPEDFFDASFVPPVTVLRPLHYSATKSVPGEGLLGCGAHSDYGMITVLATDSVPGLQAHLDEEWVDVDPVPGAFIINVGDMLHMWTNGRYKSSVHRVVNKLGVERYSIAFFYEPAFDALVECLPCCCQDEPAKFTPTTFGQHVLNKYKATHAGYEGPTVATDTKA